MLAQSQAPAPQATPAESLHAEYRADAQKHAFFADAETRQPLKLVEQPVMKWSNDDDWSGDVFLWTRDGMPSVIGCVLSGPGSEGQRAMFHEFHLLDVRPIAEARLHTNRTWRPADGLPRQPVTNAPPPAKTPTARLTQMREIAKSFTAEMEADGTWELRLLPQPLFRYEADSGGVIDGAIFAWVWSKGTDPELLLVVESRAGGSAPSWHYAPVRFTHRPLSLKYAGTEVWRAETHREPQGGAIEHVYTTAYARTFKQPPAAPQPD
jgi:hypothetical protein